MVPGAHESLVSDGVLRLWSGASSYRAGQSARAGLFVGCPRRAGVHACAATLSASLGQGLIMAGPSLTPNANDRIIDAANGQFTEIGRTLIRRLSQAVGELAPTTARYLVTTSADASALANKVNLGSLSSGYLKITSAVGVAIPSTSSSIPLADLAAGTAGINISGTSATATALATPRTINGVAFDGTGNIALDRVSVLTDGATPALDAALGSVFRLVAAGDRTIAIPTNPRDGQRILIQHKASGANRTLALNTGAGGFRFGSTITALTATLSGKTDYVEAVYNAADNFHDVIGYVKGF